MDRKEMLSERAANVVENLACRLAERHGGIVTPNRLAPYLPMSLALIKSCLDSAVDGTSILYERKDGVHHYEFAAYRDRPPASGTLSAATCIACDRDAPPDGREVLCPGCAKVVKTELNRLAEQTGWPAEAVYEHALLFHASHDEDGIVHAEELAGRTPYTVRSTRRKLDRLSTEGFVEPGLDEARGVVTYRFPAIDYPRDRFTRNRDTIRRYPASLTEEVQLRVVRILIALGLMLFGLVVLGLLHVPFPLLFPAFLLLAPIVAWTIWRRRCKVEAV
ncbi:hypothetical protein GF377_05250 [candidate division GN15 bacterium]|nr:hypothetical protein [candidate division GN15 bacterium]